MIVTMGGETFEPILTGSRRLPFLPQPWPSPKGARWVIFSHDRLEAVVLDSDFGFVRSFDFTEHLGEPRHAKSTISLSSDGTTAVAVRWPNVIVQIGSRQTHFSTPLGDTGLSSTALVLEDACYFVQPPAASTDNNEIDDHVLVKLDFATGGVTSIAPIPTHGDYVVIDAGRDLAVVAHDGQHGSTTAGIDRANGQSTIVAKLGVSSASENLTNGQSMHVATLGLDEFAPDGAWFVSGVDQVMVATWPSWEVKGQWKPANIKHHLFPFILTQDHLAVWEVDTCHLVVLDPSDMRHPIARIELPAGHAVVDAHDDRFVTVHEQTAYIWSLGATF